MENPANAGNSNVLEVDNDWPCQECGYNLRGANSIGLCPECGHSVAKSLQARPQPTWWRIIESAIIAISLIILLLIAILVT